MISPIRAVVGFRPAALVLALGIWVLSGSTVQAQSAGHCITYNGDPAYGGPSGPLPYFGTFGLGYPGYGLDFTEGCTMGYHFRNYPNESHEVNWCDAIFRRLDYAPPWGDPYTNPAALGVWPPYSAPVGYYPRP